MKIVIMEPLGIDKDALNQLINNYSFSVDVYQTKTFDEKEQLNRAKNADVLIIANTPLSKYVINNCPHLKMISVAFVGVDHVDMKACAEKNIVVSNAANYCTHAVAELAIGLTLSVLRNIPKCDTQTRNLLTKDGLIGHELYGKTFGIIGTGAIGQKTALLAKAFGCRVIAYSRSEQQTLLDQGIVYVSLDELLTSADIISLHTPLTNQTKNLIGKDALDKMKSSSILINTARGPIVDNQYLSQCLNERKIAGAGIDVFDFEPPLTADEPLSNNEHTVLTPHVAYATKESIFRRAHIVFENIQQWINDTPQNVM